MGYAKPIAILAFAMMLFLPFATVTEVTGNNESFDVSASSNGDIGDYNYDFNDEDKTASVTGFSSDPSKPNEVNIPDTVKYNNENYKVTSIGGGAFGAKNLTKITIGSNVKEILYEAFICNTKVTSITFKGDKCTLGNDSFNVLYEALSVANKNLSKITVTSPGNWAANAFNTNVCGTNTPISAFEFKDASADDNGPNVWLIVGVSQF